MQGAYSPASACLFPALFSTAEITDYWQSTGTRTVLVSREFWRIFYLTAYYINRFLAFSPAPITSATVEIDGSILSNVATHVEGPLFVCQWNPDEFSTGIHSITVKVKVYLWFILEAGGRFAIIVRRFAIVFGSFAHVQSFNAQFCCCFVLKSAGQLFFPYVNFSHNLLGKNWPSM